MVLRVAFAMRIEEAVALLQVGGNAWPAMAGEVLGRCANHPPQRRQSACDETGMDRIADADGHVVAFRHDVDDPVVESDVDADVRVADEERRDRGCDVQQAESRRARDFERAARPTLQVSEIGPRSFGDRNHLGAVLVERGTRLGHRQRTCRAIEQADTQRLLERVDLLAHQRRRDVELLRGAREGFRFDELREENHPGDAFHRLARALGAGSDDSGAPAVRISARTGSRFEIRAETNPLCRSNPGRRSSRTRTACRGHRRIETVAGTVSPVVRSVRASCDRGAADPQAARSSRTTPLPGSGWTLTTSRPSLQGRHCSPSSSPRPSPDQRRIVGAAMPIRSSTRSTVSSTRSSMVFGR